MEPITARFHWTSADRSEALAIATRSKFGIRDISPFLYFLPALAVALAGYFHTSTDRNYVLWIASGFLILVALPGIKGAFRIFAKRPHAYQVVEWSFTPEEIRYPCQDQKIQTTWSAFKKVVATPEGILFLPNAEVFRFIPERAFKTFGASKTSSASPASTLTNSRN